MCANIAASPKDLETAKAAILGAKWRVRASLGILGCKWLQLFAVQDRSQPDGAGEAASAPTKNDPTLLTTQAG